MRCGLPAATRRYCSHLVWKKKTIKRCKAFWDLYQKYYTKDKAVDVCCIYVTHVLDSRERNQWYSQIQVVRRAGLLDTIVPIRFHFDLTVDMLKLLDDSTEQKRAGFLWNCMEIYVDPKGTGSRSILFIVNVGKALSPNEVKGCAMVAGHHPDNFVPNAMVVVRHKIELWWLLFRRSTEADLADLESDVKPDKKRVPRVEYNSFFRDLSEFVIENPPIKQIGGLEDYDSAREEEGGTADGNGQVSDANRLDWIAWPMVAERYDHRFKSNAMREFRMAIREKYIRERGIRDSEVQVKLQELELTHYCFIMLVSQNMDDEFCRNSYYRLMKEGLYDVEAVVGMLSKHPYEQVQKFLANVYSQAVPGLRNRKGMSLLDFCIILRVVYDDNCPRKLMNLLAFPQVAEKKARVTLNGFGIIDEYGKDSHVLRMERLWGVDQTDLKEKYHGDYNDVIGEVCQHLNRGLNSDLSWKSTWVEALFDYMKKKDPSHRVCLRGFEEGYPTGGSGKNTKAHKMTQLEKEDEASDGGDSCRRSARLSDGS